METTIIALENTHVGNDNKQQMMTSLEIAELTGKQHKNVMLAIRNMEPGWEKVAGLKFQLGSYKDLNGQLRPCYQLTKTECLYIATKFNDEARAKLVLRWEELEKAELERRLAEMKCLPERSGGGGAVTIFHFLRSSRCSGAGGVPSTICRHRYRCRHRQCHPDKLTA